MATRRLRLRSLLVWLGVALICAMQLVLFSTPDRIWGGFINRLLTFAFCESALLFVLHVSLSAPQAWRVTR